MKRGKKYIKITKDLDRSKTYSVEEGIKEVFKEFSPILDYSDKKFQLDHCKKFFTLLSKKPKNFPRESKVLIF